MLKFFKSVYKDPVTFSSKISSVRRNFLESANEAYIMTYDKLDMNYFSKFASRELYMNVYRGLAYERPWANISDKFKRTTWTLIDVDYPDGSFVVQKQTIFDKVQVSKQLKLSVADDYTEVWKVILSDTGKYIVDSIVQA